MAVFGILVFVVLVGIAVRNEDFHLGFAAIFASLALGIGAANLSAAQVTEHFPIRLFLTLTSVTLLFSIAETNGTLGALADRAFQACRGKTRLVPVIIFILTFLVSAFGVGNIAATALMAPTAMVLARKLGLSSFLMSLVVVGGSNAASLSPFSMTGILLSELMHTALPSLSVKIIQYSVFKIFLATFATVTLVHLVGFIMLGGLTWWKNCKTIELTATSLPPMNWPQRITCVACAAFGLGILTGATSLWETTFGPQWQEFGSQLPSIALALVVILMAMRCAQTEDAIAKVPWSTIALVSGVVTYLGVLKDLGSISWISDQIRSSPAFGSVIPSIAFGSATLSSISSSSGVVLPLFIPMVSSLSTNPSTILSLMAVVAVSAHLVDCSPFSTLGALSLASAKTAHAPSHGRLFKSLLLWGLEMIPISVVLTWISSTFLLKLF